MSFKNDVTCPYSSGVYLSFTQQVQQVMEGVGTTDVCVELSDASVPIEDAIWFNITTEDDTAISKCICFQ